MDLSKRIPRIVGVVGFELKHNPNPTQEDIDKQSIRCVEEGILIACEMLIDVDWPPTKAGSPVSWAMWLRERLETYQIENLIKSVDKSEK